MRAMVLHQQAPLGADPLAQEQCPRPEPGPGQIRLRVLACGVCHTDVHIARGDLPLHRCPVIPGHQIVGEIDAVGEGVASERLGTRVGVTWLASACGQCDLCRRGQENLCREATFTGYDVDGGFAEWAVADSSFAYPLPEHLDPVECAPWLCAGVIGYRSLHVAGAGPGGRLGLFGFGASAHLTLQLARLQGCEVFVFTRSREHQLLAAELGASWVGRAEDAPPAPLDAAITFAPVGWIVREALAKLQRGGTVAINAIHLDGLPELDYREHLYWERGVRSVTNLTRRDVEGFLEIAASGGLRARVRRFPLEDANEALRQLAGSELEAAAALVPTG